MGLYGTSEARLYGTSALFYCNACLRDVLSQKLAAAMRSLGNVERALVGIPGKHSS